MPIKYNNKTAVGVLCAVAIAAFMMVAIPVYLIQPFAPQAERAVQISYFLRSWSPVLTLVFALTGVVLAGFIWKNSKRWFGRAAMIVPLSLIFVFTWFARQNHFEWMFSPLGQARFAKVAETDFVADKDMVLSVKINGDAVAFPVRQMAYHHVVQDVVGGLPITATY